MRGIKRNKASERVTKRGIKGEDGGWERGDKIKGEEGRWRETWVREINRNRGEKGGRKYGKETGVQSYKGNE